MATLLHHWKFQNNLQDAVGDVHFSNTNGTPAYTANKDGIANSCLDNSTSWYAHSTEQVTEFGDATRTYSFWVKTPETTSKSFIYQDRMFCIDRSFDSTGIAVYYRTSSTYATAVAMNCLNIWDNFTAGEWVHMCLTIENDGDKKLFVNGILRHIGTSTISPYDGSWETIINKFKNNSGYFYENVLNVDEMKYYSGILTDGGATVVGEQATEEVWELYLSGVNNINALTLNEARNVTESQAYLTWTGG